MGIAATQCPGRYCLLLFLLLQFPRLEWVGINRKSGQGKKPRRDSYPSPRWMGQRCRAALSSNHTFPPPAVPPLALPSHPTVLAGSLLARAGEARSCHRPQPKTSHRGHTGDTYIYAPWKEKRVTGRSFRPPGWLQATGEAATTTTNNGCPLLQDSGLPSWVCVCVCVRERVFIKLIAHNRAVQPCHPCHSLSLSLCVCIY